MSDLKFGAIVIGAGPGGATAALMLARAGWSVAIIEKKTFPRRKVCGEFISATSMPLLHELGVLDEFLRRAGPEVRRVGLFASDLVLTAPLPALPESDVWWGRALGREHLDLLLLEAAVRAGARIWQPYTATALRRAGNGYVCDIVADDYRTKELSAPIVIAAHGSWEDVTLPTNVGGGDHQPWDLLAFKAHLSDCDLPADLMPLLAFPGGYGGMVHSDGGRVTLSCCIRRDALARVRRQHDKLRAAETVFEHIVRHCDGVRDVTRHASLERTWLAAGPIRPGSRRRFTNGIFRVGNCAGEAHPIVAEGISMAMQSAWLLGRRLIAHERDISGGDAVDDIARRYDSDWKALFAPRIRIALILANFAMSESAAVLARPIVRLFPGLLTLGARWSGKTDPMQMTSDGQGESG